MGEKFRKRPVTVEATRWFSHGDHQAVEPYLASHYIRPDRCTSCHEHFDAHGWILTLEGGHIVCPGDWIITGIAGEHYPCKPEIFAATYDRVEDGDA